MTAILVGDAVGGQDLDGDLATKPRVARAIDLAHPTRADGARISYGPSVDPEASGTVDSRRFSARGPARREINVQVHADTLCVERQKRQAGGLIPLTRK